ncbi:DHH phosphoesterase [Irpex rosettiformis]|uniref:DHH phosphoesterase n=1 Tax=Irpex rosettiformis TaxID=378272 RepID=A0ACB8U612_9APHY|nr:DHH phosphoesterase [Irpex rosettiformis]
MSRTDKSHMKWPSSEKALQTARSFLQQCANCRSRTLLVPDKDADGLCASMIIYRTLTRLGLPSDQISVHFVAKGSNVHSASEQERMEAYNPRFVIVADQGSRRGGPIVRGKDVDTLIVDHHWTDTEDDFPEGAIVLSAARYPPIATSSTLSYILCKPLIGKGYQEEIDYLCAIGTYGDLGTSFDFKPSPPWPLEDIEVCVRRCTKKALGEAVALLNAPRRTATYDVHSAWDALLQAGTSPRSILSFTRLHAARREVNSEVAKVARNRPWFSGDGRVALIRVTNGAQIHPIIATRWAGSLKSKKLEVVMCANDGYLPGMTNFSCRVAKCAKERINGSGEGSVAAGKKRSAEELEGDTDAEGKGVDIIAILNRYASQESGLRESMGYNFARGHKEASGGIVRTEDFERLWKIMQDSKPEQNGDQAGQGRNAAKRRKKSSDFPAQKNTLEGWVTKN